MQFAQLAAQKIGEMRESPPEGSGELGERLDEAVEELGEATVRLAIHEGAARTADSVAPGSGVVVRKALTTEKGEKAVGMVAKPVGKVVGATFRKARRTLRWALVAGGFLLLVAVGAAMALAVWTASLFADTNVEIESAGARVASQTKAVQPEAFFSPSPDTAVVYSALAPAAVVPPGLSAGGTLYKSNLSQNNLANPTREDFNPGFASNLASITVAAHARLVNDWVESHLDTEGVTDVENIELEILGDGGIRLSGTLVIDTDDGEQRREVESERWYYQASRNCHPAVLAAQWFPNPTPSGIAVGSECWALDVRDTDPSDEVHQVLGWLVETLDGQGAVWRPPLYDYAQCVEVTREEAVCAQWFENAEGGSLDVDAAFRRCAEVTGEEATCAQWYENAGGAAAPREGGPVAVWLSSLPVALRSPDGSLGGEGEGVDLKLLHSDSKMGRLTLGQIAEDGLHYTYELLVTEGTEALARDLYTTWLVWHEPRAHVPHHHPPPHLPDLECSESFAQGQSFGGGTETPRGRAWVEHFTSMGSSLSEGARGDVLGGCATRPLLALLGYAASRKEIVVAPIRTGHTPWVAGTNRESFHHRGRAADISVVRGERVYHPNPQGYWLWRWLVEMMGDGRFGISEIGSPWDVHPDVPGDGIFTDDSHKGHIHVAVCGKRYTHIDSTGAVSGEEGSCP